MKVMNKVNEEEMVLTPALSAVPLLKELFLIWLGSPNRATAATDDQC